jgi:transposase
MKKHKLNILNRAKRKKDFINNYKPIIENHKNDLPIFPLNQEYLYENINTNSWFSIDRYINNEKTNFNLTRPDKNEINNYKTVKIDMELLPIHKKIFDNWFDANTNIYNKTLDYIRTNFNFTKKEIIKSILSEEIKNNPKFFNKYYIRNQLNKVKKDIQKEYSFTIDKEFTKTKKKDIKCSIDIHTLDKSIFQLVQNIDATKTNMLKNNIKRFRLKFWKYIRPSKTIEIEKTKFKNGYICDTLFKHLEDIKYYYNGKPYNLNKIECDFKINYNSILDKYTLLLSVPIDDEFINNKKNIIILDPGLRTFMTGLSNTENINFGDDVNKIIKKDISRLNKVKNNKDIKMSIKKKVEKNINKKIYNKIEELHWKVINYLTKNYKTIFLGDMSAKSIVANSNKTLSGEMKTACLRTRYYEFHKRLVYKCSIRKNNFKLINEYYTSKTCSICGTYKEDLGGNKIYKCSNCKCSINRDINGCRNIYMKQFL